MKYLLVFLLLCSPCMAQELSCQDNIIILLNTIKELQDANAWISSENQLCGYNLQSYMDAYKSLLSQNRKLRLRKKKHPSVHAN